MELIYGAERYLNPVHDLMRVFRDEGKVLDKPNLHRLLEIFVHTITTFGHIRNIGEMVLESYHQVMKAGVLGNSHIDSHIKGMEHALSRDWQLQLMNLYDFYRREGEKRGCDFPGMMRILIGETSLLLNEDDATHAGIVKIIRDGLKSDWIGLLRKHLNFQMKVNGGNGDNMKRWEGYGNGKSPFVDDIRHAKQTLRLSRPGRHFDGSVVKEYSHAVLSFHREEGERRHTYVY